MSKVRAGETIVLSADIQLGEGKKAPTEIRLFVAGENPTDRGYPILFDEIAAAMVMESFRTDGKPRLYADWNHGMLPKDPDHRPTREEAQSSCSFVPEVRNGELWAADIDWTDDGRADVESKKYNLFSPAFNPVEDEMTGAVRPRDLVNFALVNLAGLRNIKPLLAAMAARREETDMTAEEIKRLQDRNAELEKEVVALRAAAGEVTALTGVMSLAATADAPARAEALRGLVGFRGEVLTLTGQDSVAGARGVLAGWKQKADGYDKFAEENAQRELTALTGEIEAVITGASKDGRAGFEPANIAQRRAEALLIGGGKPSKAGVTFLTTMAASMPKAVVTVADGGARQPADGVTLTAGEKALAARSNVTEASMLKAKKNVLEQNAKRAAGRAS